jgi:hypothetical protein
MLRATVNALRGALTSLAPRQPHRYLCVIDFEATCDDNVPFEYFSHEVRI